MQYACSVLSSAACLALVYFFTISHKWRDFRREVSENNFSTNLAERFLILRRTERDIMMEVYRSPCKVSVKKR